MLLPPKGDLQYISRVVIVFAAMAASFVIVGETMRVLLCVWGGR